MPITISEDAFFINKDAPEGLQMQLRQAIAGAVLAGRIRVGDRLPSSRKLANHLKIARITVTLAYQELVADGYIASRDRSGYFIADTAPNALPLARSSPGGSVDWSTRITRRTDHAPIVEKTLNWRDYPYPFIYGQADPKLFNHSSWRACAHRALGRRDFDALAGDYVQADDPELVDFIARHTLPRRGIAARPEEILITLGAQNALWIVSNLLLGPGKTAIVENPGYPGIRDVVGQVGADLRTIDVDVDGLPPEAIPQDADVVFVTPSHQCPTTVTMPMQRRKALLNAATAQDFLIVEDDYEFEMSFLRPPHPALRSIDEAGRVIYIGSFSKSLFPGLRLGYLVGPEAFVREARALRTTMLRHPPGHIQRTTAYFLALGHYDALIRRLRDTFQLRREVMGEALSELGLSPVHSSVFGGTSFWIKGPPNLDSAALLAALRPLGVLIEPGTPFFGGASPVTNHYRIAYSSIAHDKIRAGLEILATTQDRLTSGDSRPKNWP